MPPEEPDFLPDTPHRFARLIKLTSQEDEPWQPQDLAAIWRHQISVPRRFDFPDENAEVPAVTRPENGGAPDKGFTWNGLLRDPQPSVELLRLTKDFAKAKRQHSSPGFPKEIARVLCFASILLALMKCGQRITQLSDAEILEGAEWSLTQSWLDQDTLNLLGEGKEFLRRSGLASE